ncbi:MAG: hypothetical protein EZS28_016038 [Streblomastix strix]|uniref:Uncharacterized protein n=1 Tax=Streblomastix strix TaxID=222440 RepID=A0A5J4W0R2_9EUKA|nr:MAG: hypothetical protein EZS28_016038 [Streblomastix strix]
MNIADVQDIVEKFWQGRQLPQQKELFLQKRVTFWSQLRYATKGSAEFGRIALKLMNCPTSEASCERNFSELRRKLGHLKVNLETIKFLGELQILETAKQKLEQKKQNVQGHNKIDITSESVIQSAKGQDAKLTYSILAEKVENSKYAENSSFKQSACREPHVGESEISNVVKVGSNVETQVSAIDDDKTAQMSVGQSSKDRNTSNGQLKNPQSSSKSTGKSSQMTIVKQKKCFMILLLI